MPRTKNKSKEEGKPSDTRYELRLTKQEETEKAPKVIPQGILVKIERLHKPGVTKSKDRLQLIAEAADHLAEKRGSHNYKTEKDWLVEFFDQYSYSVKN